jgi:hypothetical protein
MTVAAFDPNTVARIFPRLGETGSTQETVGRLNRV